MTGNKIFTDILKTTTKKFQDMYLQINIGFPLN